MANNFNQKSSEYAALLQDYNETISSLGEINQKKYNLKTIYNLIYHFDNLNLSSDDKQYIYTSILDYLHFIREIKGPLKIKDSNELYVQFLSPIVKYYIPFGFSANLSWLVLIFLVIFSTPILIILDVNFRWYLLIYLIFFLLKLRTWVKQKQHKIYGPKW